MRHGGAVEREPVARAIGHDKLAVEQLGGLVEQWLEPIDRFDSAAVGLTAADSQ